jgi:dolichol kinase
MKTADEQNRALKKELMRKLIHLLELPALLAYTLVASFYGAKFGILLLTALLIILLEIEYIRLEYKLKLPLVIDILRRHEKDNIAGNIFFVSSTIICFAAFDYPIALIALLCTVFGDMMAALVGIRFGRTRIAKKKTLEGFLAGFLTNVLVGYLIIPGAWQIFLPMALTAALVELWTGKLDDNLTVPIAAGFAGQMLIFFTQNPLSDFPGPVLGWIINFLPFI